MKHRGSKVPDPKHDHKEGRAGVAPKVNATGHSSDSGSTDAELCRAAAGLNSPKKGGLPGV